MTTIRIVSVILLVLVSRAIAQQRLIRTEKPLNRDAASVVRKHDHLQLHLVNTTGVFPSESQKKPSSETQLQRYPDRAFFHARASNSAQPTIGAAKEVEDSVTKGTQLCHGDSPSKLAEGSIALVLTGAAFRAKTFISRCKVQCVRGTKEVQQRVSENQVSTLVKPFEKMGYRVDIFLTPIECELLENSKSKGWCTKIEPNDLTPHFTSYQALQLLKDTFGHQRVAGIVNTTTSRGHLLRVQDALTSVQDRAVALGMSYEFVIVTRYDIRFEFSSLLDLLPRQPRVTGINGINASFIDKAVLNTLSSAHRRLNPPTRMLRQQMRRKRQQKDLQRKPASEVHLTFFAAAEDYVFMFPGGLMNCVIQLFRDCFNHTGRLQTKDPMKFDTRKECIEWGPVTLKEFDSRGQDYLKPLLNIREALSDLQQNANVPFVVNHRFGSAGVFTADAKKSRKIVWASNPPSYEDGGKVPDTLFPYHYAVK